MPYPDEYNAFPGDIMMSFSYGTYVGRAITRWQGRATKERPIVKWSHTAVCLGDGRIAEATTPRGQIRSLDGYTDNGNLMAIYRVPSWTWEQRVRVAGFAGVLTGKPYDYLNIARHLVDNIVERLTWNTRRQKGWRPLASGIKDTDGVRNTVCSELVEWAVHLGTSRTPYEIMHRSLMDHFNGAEMREFDGDRMGARVGQARPLDVWRWLGQRGAYLVLQMNKGRITYRRVNDD